MFRALGLMKKAKKLYNKQQYIYIYVYFKENKTLILQAYIKLIKSD